MLEVKNLKKSFGNRVILDDVNLTVKDDEILCIVGPSGAGKTTLLRCITGLDTPDSGEFLMDGKPFDPQGTGASAARSRCPHCVSHALSVCHARGTNADTRNSVSEGVSDWSEASEESPGSSDDSRRSAAGF